ncbi:MAG: DUF4124 domain-containing protein [Desulfobacterales bacterium]
MRSLTPYISIIIMWLWGIPLNAGSIYTWQDENGVTHISEKPPPAGTKLEAVIEYTPKTEEEIRSIRRQQEARREERAREAVLKNAQNARKIADEAKTRAEEAKRRAEQANQKAQEFRNKIGYDTDRIKRNRYKIKKMELEALKAVEFARQAAEEAQMAEEQAKAAEKRANEMINEDNPSKNPPTETEQ